MELVGYNLFFSNLRWESSGVVLLLSFYSQRERFELYESRTT